MRSTSQRPVPFLEIYGSATRILSPLGRPGPRRAQMKLGDCDEAPIEHLENISRARRNQLQDEKLKNPAALATILADTTPNQWSKIIRRVQTVDRYKAIPKPTSQDADVAANELGLTQAGFYRLLRSLKRPRPWEGDSRGRDRGIEPEIEQLVDEVVADLGPVGNEHIHAEVASRAIARNLPVPTFAQVVTRLDDQPTKPNIRGFLRRDADLVADAAVLPVPVVDAPVNSAVWLTAIIDASGGRVLSHSVTMLPPGIEVAAELLASMPPLRWRATKHVLAHSRGLPDLAPLSATLADIGVEVSRKLSKNISPGRPLRAVFGRRIGRMRILEIPPGRISREDQAVPMEYVGPVVSELIRRRNQDLPSDIVA